MFSSILYRPEESVDEFISFNNILKEYISYEFNKHFNMTIDDYLSLTFFEKKYLIRMVHMKEKLLQEQMKKHEEEQKKNKDKVDYTKQPANIGELEEMERLGVLGH